MSNAQASVFQKHRTAGDVGGDNAWAVRLSGRALRRMPEQAAKDIEADFELAEGDRVLWRLLHLPRRFSDLEKSGVLPAEDLRAALRAFIAADVVEVVDGDQGKALLPAEIKRARTEASGKAWRPSGGALVGKVYRPDIEGGGASVEGSTVARPEPVGSGSATSASASASRPATTSTSPGLQAPRTATGSMPASMPAPPTSPASPASRPAAAPAASTATAPATSAAPSLNAPRTATGSAPAASTTTSTTTATATATSSTKAGPAIPSAPDAIGGRPLMPADKTTYIQLAQAFATMSRIDHYAFLGVTTTAEESAIRAAYVGLARDYHPDRIAGSPLADDSQVRMWIEALFKRLGDAQKTLMNAESRARYDREQKALASSPTGGTTSSDGRQRRPIEARNAFVMAETFFKKKDYAQAELHYRQAANFDPEEGLIAVGLAWCIFVNPDQPAEKRLEDARKRLEEATKKFRSGDAAYKLGRVLREMGDEAGASKRFEDAVRLTPNHVDAQREIRIIEMRRQKAESEKAEGDQVSGLIGKLFKR
jgi:curved DNA-binding protein CbpA